MIHFLLRFFFKKPLIKLYKNSNTVPEALGYNEPQFKKLVDDLVTMLPDDDRIAFMRTFFEGPLLEKYKLNLNIPNHSLITGYALCIAFIVKGNIMRNDIANKVINAFNSKTVN